MKTIKPATLLGMFLLATATGCDSPAKTKAPEPPAIQGRWSGFENGKPGRLTLVLSTNQFAYFDDQTNEIGGGAFVMNHTIQPMQMDLTFERIPAPDLVGKVGHAIFELNGDELKIAGCELGSDERPTNMVAGGGVRVFVFKRE